MDNILSGEGIMNKPLTINLFYSDDGEDLLEVLNRDFKEFLNLYIKKVLQ